MKTIAPKMKDTLIHSFFGGIAWGLGLTVGLTFVAFLLRQLLNAVGGVPVVGDWIANIVKATLFALNK